MMFWLRSTSFFGLGHDFDRFPANCIKYIQPYWSQDAVQKT